MLTEQKECEIVINPDDIEMWFSRGTGPGGQKKNKTFSSVFFKHIPTGIVTKSEDERSQHQNREIAWDRLKIKLQELEDSKLNGSVTENRNSQIGNGERCDKRRTYRDKEDLVIDHITNKTARLKDVWKGKLNLLHK